MKDQLKFELVEADRTTVNVILDGAVAISVRYEESGDHTINTDVSLYSELREVFTYAIDVAFTMLTHPVTVLEYSEVADMFRLGVYFGFGFIDVDTIDIPAELLQLHHFEDAETPFDLVGRVIDSTLIGKE